VQKPILNYNLDAMKLPLSSIPGLYIAHPPFTPAPGHRVVVYAADQVYAPWTTHPLPCIPAVLFLLISPGALYVHITSLHHAGLAGFLDHLIQDTISNMLTWPKKLVIKVLDMTPKEIFQTYSQPAIVRGTHNRRDLCPLPSLHFANYLWQAVLI